MEAGVLGLNVQVQTHAEGAVKPGHGSAQVVVHVTATAGKLNGVTPTLVQVNLLNR